MIATLIAAAVAASVPTGSPLDAAPVPAVSFNDGNNNTACLPVYVYETDTRHIIAAKLRELADMVDATGCANAIFLETPEGDD